MAETTLPPHPNSLPPNQRNYPSTELSDATGFIPRLRPAHQIASLPYMARKTKYPERSHEVPVTQKMLFIVRDELVELIKSEAKRTDSKFSKLESVMKSELHGMRSEIHGMKSDLHRIALLVEEQNARNAIVMDGLTNLFERQERIEQSRRE